MAASDFWKRLERVFEEIEDPRGTEVRNLQARVRELENRHRDERPMVSADDK